MAVVWAPRSVVLFLVLLATCRGSFNVAEFCASRCLYGKGGVLCHCSAMHFNGKRSGQLPDLLAIFKQLNREAGSREVRRKYFSTDEETPHIPLIRFNFPTQPDTNLDGSIDGYVNIPSYSRVGSRRREPLVGSRERLKYGDTQNDQRAGGNAVPTDDLSTREELKTDSPKHPEDLAEVSQKVVAKIKEIMGLSLAEDQKKRKMDRVRTYPTDPENDEASRQLRLLQLHKALQTLMTRDR